MIEIDESLKALLLRVAHEIEAEAKEIAPKREGDLARDIQVFDESIGSLEVAIGNSLLIDYAPFVHGGTGLYGPKRKRITPRTKKALKTPYGPRKSIAGQKPQPYLDDAVENFMASGKLDMIFDEYADSLGDEIFDAIRSQLKSLHVDAISVT